MADSHSFTEYVGKMFDNQFWAAAENFLQENKDALNINYYKIHRPGDFEIQSVQVEHVWIEDLPEMKIQFDVALSVDFEVHEDNYHYDEMEEKTVWLMVRCRGDLAHDLADFEIFEITDYNGKNRAKNPMDDSLVPVIYKDNLEKVAEQFLRNHYKKALLEPMWVNPTELAESMGLTVRFVNITKEGSVFGRNYFHPRKTEIFDLEKNTSTIELIPAKTILVDKQMAFMYVLGATNNTIIHECVHWDKHQKAFALARLYNKDLTNISCEVEGGAAENKGVSRTVAKIRMLDAGYEEAMGAFTYIDGRYVKPHKATKGFLKPNQTFSISTYDLAIMKFSSAELRDTLDKGRYIYVDSQMDGSVRDIRNKRTGAM